MTREELKRHCLKQIENCEMWARFKGEEPSGKVYEEHKLILELLEQEPCEDAISRQAVLDNAYAYGNGLEPDGYCVNVEDIQALPPVTPQPKTGHWILTSDDDCEYCTCSECGYQNGENWMIGSVIKFCQECGAKMVEPQESEE